MKRTDRRALIGVLFILSILLAVLVSAPRGSDAAALPAPTSTTAEPLPVFVPITIATTTTTTTTTTIDPALTHCDCVGSDCDSYESEYRWHFARLVLDELGLPQHQHACLFLTEWFMVENSGHHRMPPYSPHNPYGRKPNGRLARHQTIYEGARTFAQQLDGSLPSSIHSYPAIVGILRDAPHYPSAEAMARNEHVGNDLTKWCSCDAGRKHSYRYDTIWRLRDAGH